MLIYIPKGEVYRKVSKATDGILGTAVDMVLVSIYFGFEASFAGYGRSWKAGERADNTLAELNYETIKRSLYYLKHKGLVKTVVDKAKEGLMLTQITSEGIDRLNSKVPKYRKKRTWDGRVYLITYDLPIRRNKDRDRLREFMKKMGCGMLQQSVWVTPYNPKDLIREFVKSSSLEGSMILISSLKKDGNVGDKNLAELLSEVYKLDELNERYEEFIRAVDNKELTDRSQVIFAYLSILDSDPQIPFKLLPYGWRGDEAHKVFKNYVGRD